MTRHLKEDAQPLHGLPVKLVKRRNIASLLSDLRDSRGDSTADHVRSSLSSFFTWVLKEGLMGDEAANPVTYTHKEKPRKRERVLTIDELREIWEATEEEGDYNKIVRLLMFTPQRREEIGALDRVKETDFKTGLITFYKSVSALLAGICFSVSVKVGIRDGPNPRKNLTNASWMRGAQRPAREQSQCPGDCTICDGPAIRYE
jgi:integrase